MSGKKLVAIISDAASTGRCLILMFHGRIGMLCPHSAMNSGQNFQAVSQLEMLPALTGICYEARLRNLSSACHLLCCVVVVY